MNNTTNIGLNLDQPLVSVKQDKLGRGQFAQNLAETIIEYPPGPPLVIGLYGTWGSGKTSVINFVKEHIENAKKGANQEKAKALPDFVYFDSWLLANQQELVERFLETIIRQISCKDKKTKYEQIANNLEKMLHASKLVSIALSRKTVLSIAKIVFALGLFPGAIGILARVRILWILGAGLLILSSLVSLFHDTATELVSIYRAKSREKESLIELRDQLHENLKGLENNIVVVIDEIDRLTIDEVKLVFQLVKSTFNLPHIIYLLAFDRDKISTAISSDKFDGDDYIEKIVQLPVYMPTPDRQLIETFLDEKIQTLIQPLPNRYWDDKWWREVYGQGLRNIILSENNPRTIIRLFNKIRSELYSLLPEVNPVDFIAISVIQAVHPNIYDYVALRKSIFTRDLITGLEGALRGEDAIKKDVTAYFSKLDYDVASLIRLLFPTIEEYLGDTKYGRGWEQTWLAEKRICSGLCFDRYFNRTVPIGEATYSALEEFIDCDNLEELEKRLQSELKNGTLMDFLARLESLVSMVPEKNTENIIVSLFNISEKFPPEYDDYWESPDLRLINVITGLLSKLNRAASPRVLESSIRESKGVFSPVYLINSYAKKKDEGRSSEVPIDEDQMMLMRLRCVERIEEWYKSKKLIAARHLDFILSRWKSWSDKKFIDVFLEETLRDENMLIRLLPRFVRKQTHTDSSGTKSVYSYDFDGLSRFLDLQAVNNKSIGLWSSGASKYPQEQARALELFVKDYPSFKGKATNE